MLLNAIVQSLILGIVEGLTEFLPISSTGHLILVSSVLGITGEKWDVFEIVIQGAAILAVCWACRARLMSMLKGLGRDPVADRLAVNLSIAFLPLAALGFLFHKMIKAVLFHPVPVAIALVLGGVVILWVERCFCQVRTQSIDDISKTDALKLGFAQALALIPGTSRSGATIIGGLLFGLSRRVATEFSFLLAIPTLLVATGYQLYKARHMLAMSDMPLFFVGCLSAFLSALWAVRFFLKYVSTHSFRVFAWYRIVFGLGILLSGEMGWIHWA